MGCGGVRPIICNSCGTAVAELVGGYLVIKAKHHGEQHVTVLNLVSLASGLKLL
jgi:DNA-directed RNA polymerase subunit N (RpoN/RPB10)